MTTYHYTHPFLVWDRDTGQPLVNATGGLAYTLADPPVEVTVTNLATGVPVTGLVTGDEGILGPEFTSDNSVLLVMFGAVGSTVRSDEQSLALEQATAAQAAAEAAQAAAEAAEAKAFPVTYVGLDPDGTVWVSDEPVVNGGTLVLNQDGTIDAVFPY